MAVYPYQVRNLAAGLSRAQRRTIARLSGHRGPRSAQQLGARQPTLGVLLRYRLIRPEGAGYRRTELGDLVARELRAHLAVVK